MSVIRLPRSPIRHGSAIADDGSKTLAFALERLDDLVRPVTVDAIFVGVTVLMRRMTVSMRVLSVCAGRCAVLGWFGGHVAMVVAG
jgi:hypothetical protein